MTGSADVVDAADRAFALVEAVDEAWLYRYASQSMLDAENTCQQSVMFPGTPAAELFVNDPAEPGAWIQGEFQAVGR